LINTHLSVGSNILEIHSFLETHKFDYKDELFEDIKYLITDSSSNKLKEAKGIEKRQVAWINNVDGILLGTNDIRVIFYLDEQNNPVTFEVKMFGTGL
jgi:hypothetical protein